MPSPSGNNPANQGPWDGSSGTNSASDDELLQQIRKRFHYFTKRWEKIRKAAEDDDQALGPDGPNAEEKQARKELKRPFVHLDQLNQYPLQLVNQVRADPLGVKVEPAGNGATEKTATLRGSRIRAIETKWNASQAYLTALDCAARRSYGVVTLETQDISWDGFDQEIVIVREPDPDALLWDPDAKAADSSDMKDGFKVWQVPIDQFKRDWPKATVTDFTGDHQGKAPDWINLDRQMVQIARYSYFKEKQRYLYILDDGTPKGQKIFKDELPEGSKVSKGFVELADGRQFAILKEKKAIQKSVKQCITNGIEILDCDSERLAFVVGQVGQ